MCPYLLVLFISYVLSMLRSEGVGPVYVLELTQGKLKRFFVCVCVSLTFCFSHLFSIVLAAWLDVFARFRNGQSSVSLTNIVNLLAPSTGHLTISSLIYLIIQIWFQVTYRIVTDRIGTATVVVQVMTMMAMMTTRILKIEKILDMGGGGG
jgi:hypothetical protein